MSQQNPSEQSAEKINEHAKKQEAQSQESLKNPNITLRFMAAPMDVLNAGAQGISGGRVLEWIDKAAYACATQWSGQYCVTVYVGHIHFMRPIESGHLVEVRSRSEEHTSELQSRGHLVCRLLLEKKKKPRDMDES